MIQLLRLVLVLVMALRTIIDNVKMNISHDSTIKIGICVIVIIIVNIYLRTVSG